MPLPAGVTTATATAKAPVSVSGDPGLVYVEVKPSINLVHIATGTPIASFIEVRSADEGSTVNITLPHTNQSGFQGDNGLPVTGWSYLIDIRYQNDEQLVHIPTKQITIPTGTNTVDLGLMSVGTYSDPTYGTHALVTSVNGMTGAVTVGDGITQAQLDAKANIASPTFTGTVGGITKSMVGLGNVDNTSDLNKPVSTATQTALDAKATVTALNAKAPLASPTFTGTPVAPTINLEGANGARASFIDTATRTWSVGNVTGGGTSLTVTDETAAAVRLAISSAGAVSPGATATQDFGASAAEWNNGFFAKLLVSGAHIVAGTGTPEGAVTAPAGSIYLNKSGGPATTLYVKESGTGTVGWVAAGSGTGTGGLDAEGVRDTIGSALVAANGIAITVNDAGDTITIASTATATGLSVLNAATAADARTAIGAGTSSLAIGTTSTTAKAGNWAPTIADMPTGYTHARSKIAGVWQDRGTTRTDITVMWIGPTPHPDIVVAPATNGMYENDIRIVTAT